MRAHHRHYIAPEPLPLFEPPPLKDLASDIFRERHETPPSVAVDTSREAASRIAGRTNRLREAVFLFIRAVGGATAGEISTQCGLNPSTVRPRLRELEGSAPWCHGKLSARIVRTAERRKGMRIYVAI